jgi:iron-sulfur cluster repair protein YtfE (RIC family)
MNATFETTIRDIVAEDFRAAAVFQKFEIDFCCGADEP